MGRIYVVNFQTLTSSSAAGSVSCLPGRVECQLAALSGRFYMSERQTDRERERERERGLMQQQARVRLVGHIGPITADMLVSFRCDSYIQHAPSLASDVMDKN